MMKHFFDYILLSGLLVSALLVGGCADAVSTSQEEVVKSERVVEKRAVVRYGVDVSSYRLHTDRLKSAQTMGDIMHQYGRTASDIDKVDRASRELFSLRRMRVGNEYTLFLAKDSTGRERVEYIAYERDRLNYVLFVMCGDSIAVRLAEKPSKVVRHRVVVPIEGSLMGAINRCGLPYELGVELEEIFQWSVDLFTLRRGDRFTVLYDERYVDDSISVGIDAIRGAKFSSGTTRGIRANIVNYAIPFEQGGRVDYWDEGGNSVRKQMLKSPLKYTRLSSNNSSSAKVAAQVSESRTTLGVDYIAPTGTHIHTVADGVVSYVGEDDRNGQMVTIRHANNIESGYSHLSRFARGLEKGSRIAQGDLIGYVGSSGDSDAPHLGYRVWVEGEEIDPLSVPMISLSPVSEANRAHFERLRDEIVAALDGGEATTTIKK